MGDYLDDEEVIDVKAGGGKEIKIGEMVKQFLNKLEWFDTRFPRIPVPVQKEITDYFEQMEKYTIGQEDVQEAEKNAKKEEQKQRILMIGVLTSLVTIGKDLDHLKEAKNVNTIKVQAGMIIGEQMTDISLVDRSQGTEATVEDPAVATTGMTMTIKLN